jgi:hypothetical protein
LRQGNTNEKVQIYRYISRGTFDSYLYQTIELKQKFISQIMTSKNPVRSCEDVDESVLSYAEIKALAAGNPKIKEKMELDVQVAKLRVAKTSHQTSQYTLQDKLRKELPPKKAALENRLTRLRADVELRNANSPNSQKTPKSDENGAKDKDEKEMFAMAINGHVYDKRDEAAKELMALTNVYHDIAPIKIGSYRGFDMTLEFNPHFDLHHLTLKGNDSYRINMGDSASGNITRISNVLNGFESKISEIGGELKDCENQERLATEQLAKPFEREDELTEKSARLAKLNLELNIDSHGGGTDDEDELILSEDEEYDYRNELSETGIGEADLFSRQKDDPDEVVVGVGEELTEQGKNDDLRSEIENGASLDIDGTLIGNAAEKPVTSADIYGEKMNLENYADYRYPKAAQFLDLHNVNVTSLEQSDDAMYSLLVEGTVNSVLQREKFDEPSLNPYSVNNEYHYIRDCAMVIVSRKLELPDFPEPRGFDGPSAAGLEALRKRGAVLAESALYGHLPRAERDAILQAGSNSHNEIGKDSGVKITSLADYAEERKAIIAEAKRKLAEDGAMPIITDAMEGRAYEGEILEIGAAYAVQKIDEGRGIIHNLEYLKDFSRVINSSGVPYLEITYDGEMNGRVGAKNTAERGRIASIGR